MQSKRKSNGIIGHTVADAVITFTVGPQSFMVDCRELCGQYEIDDGPQPRKEYAWDHLSETGQMAVIHGVVQKVSDRAAIGRDPETGASATPEEKFAAMKECADRLMAGGPWNAVATGGGASAGGLLYRAMRALYPKAWSDRVTFAAYIAEKAISESARLGKKVSESDVRAGLMAVKQVSKEIERIRAEEGKLVAIDAGGMLQELEGTGKA